MIGVNIETMEELTLPIWDAIIIGTGMGGSTLGYALVAADKNVLFLDKGRAYFKDQKSIKGIFSEEFALQSDKSGQSEKMILSQAGRYTGHIIDSSAKHSKSFIPFLGEGSGGSSALYGAVLERFRPEDFEPGKYFKKDCGSLFPDKWPIDYNEMKPYYETAEKLYHVQESNSKADNPVAQEMVSFLRDKNLSPYWLPIAHEISKDCPGCQGFICSAHAKYDSVKACLIPAIDQGAKFLDECEVVRLNEENGKIKSVDCLWNGYQLNLKAELFILAAGAINSPGILLKSKSDRWPEGLANSSGLVGKNLMRHYIDLYVIRPRFKFKKWSFGSGKDMAFNDYYISQGEKLGTVQSFGRLPNGDVIAEQMVEEAPPIAGKILSLLRPFIAPILNKLFDRSYIFTSIIEDLPYEENRVYFPVDSQTLHLTYRINHEEKRRIKMMRKKLKKLFSPYRPMILKQAENNKRIAHACGTCRFGTDNKTSVLNQVNRTHDCENLYIVDSSFFPTAGGMNPSLTIAANALRVAKHILGDDV